MRFFLRNHRGRFDRSFSTREEAFAYACAIEEYGAGADVELWALLTEQDGQVVEMLPPGLFWTAAEQWRAEARRGS